MAQGVVKMKGNRRKPRRARDCGVGGRWEADFEKYRLF